MEAKLNNIISKIDRLPMPGGVALEVVQLCSDLEVSISKLTKIINTDQSLTAQILRIANSSYFNYPKMISSIDRAIIVLGFNLLKDISLSLAFHSFYKGFGDDNDDNDFQNLWRHSILSAVVSKALAQKFDPDNQDVFYVAGLLHDIGKLVASKTIPKDFLFLKEKCKQENIRLDQIERKFLDFHHGDIGSYLIEKWNLPDVLVNMIRFHHHPDEYNGDYDYYKQIRFIYLSNIVAHYIDEEFTDINDILQYDEEFPKYFSFAPDEFGELISEIKEIIEKNNKLLEIHLI